MLQKLIDQIKSKLYGILEPLAQKVPEKLRPQIEKILDALAPEEEGEEYDEDATGETQIKTEISDIDEIEESEDDEDDGGEKKKLPIKKIALILLAFYVAWEFLFPPETKQMIQKTVNTQKEQLLQKQKGKNSKVSEAKTHGEQSESEQKSTENQVQNREQQQKQASNISEQNGDTFDSTSENNHGPDIDQPNNEIVSTGLNGVNKVENDEQDSYEDEQPSSPEKLDLSMIGENSQGDDISENLDNKKDRTDLTALILKQTGGQAEENLNKKSKLFIHVTPDYEELGRGLVYNCTGRHWACLNKKNYKKCYQNQEFSKQNDKNPECHVFQIYATVRDCIIMQRHNTNKPEKTDFCQ